MVFFLYIKKLEIKFEKKGRSYSHFVRVNMIINYRKSSDILFLFFISYNFKEEYTDQDTH